MQHFTTEPERLILIKWILLIIGSLGFIIFLFEYFVAWLYPIIGSTFNRLILFHLFHLMLIIATCVVRGSLVRLPWFAVYMGSYIICFIVDVVGVVWRTVLFDQASANLSTVNDFVGTILEWFLPVISLVMVILSILIARMTLMYFYAQDLIVAVLSKDVNNPMMDILIEKNIRKLSLEFGFLWTRTKKESEKQK
jgi:hypothetical protein